MLPLFQKYFKAYSSLRLAVFCLALAAFFVAVSPASSAEIINEKTDGYVDIPDVRASFKPVKGLVLSERFSGLESSERNIEIIAALISSPFESIAENFTKSTLKLRGIDMLSRSEVSINGKRGVLVKALHPEEDIRWGKWILLLENGDATLVVNGVFVSGDEDAAVDVEAMLKGVVPLASQTPAREEKPAAAAETQPINEEEGN